MQKALDQLGFGKCYHMRTAMNEYPRDCAMWLEAFEAKYDGKGSFGKRQWDQLLGHYSVGCCFQLWPGYRCNTVLARHRS